MLFAIKATFKPGEEAQRQAAHDSFSGHLEQTRLRVRLAGALKDDAGARLGLLVLMEAETRADVEAFVETSPYTRAGLYQRVEIEVLDVEVGSLG